MKKLTLITIAVSLLLLGGFATANDTGNSDSTSICPPVVSDDFVIDVIIMKRKGFSFSEMISSNE